MHLESVGKDLFTDFIVGAAQEWNKLMRLRDSRLPAIDQVNFVMDNSSIHCQAELKEALGRYSKSPAVQQAKNATKSFAVHFLPVYSPMLNPIESVFAVHKHNVSKLLEDRREELLEIDHTNDGQKLTKRTEILQQVSLQGWQEISVTMHANFFTHASRYQERCLRKIPIDTEVNFHSEASELLPLLVPLGEATITPSNIEISSLI